MNILVIGGGGREHAIVKKLSESRYRPRLFCLPGNAGISGIAECIQGSVMDFDFIVKECKDREIDLCFVAPDDPLGGGLVDRLEAEGIRAFGPKKNAAILESSKAFSKDFMKRNGIPTAEYENFDSYDAAKKYLKTAKFPLVIKADGLALGKGVIICESLSDGEKALADIMQDKVFGLAGSRVVIEEFLEGKEVSLLAFTDGITTKCMPSSQDHKKAFDGDKGLNTGGMGAFTPSLAYTRQVEEEVLDGVVTKTIKALHAEGRTFKGVIYFGLMLTKDGVKVLEYNARFGDPETQAVLPLLKTDFVDIIDACIDGRLDLVDIEWEDKASLVVILASGGYPEKIVKGYPIEMGKIDEDVTVFHSGTAIKDGKTVTNGGRVLGVSCKGDSIEDARLKIYSNIKNISFKDMQYRTDIGLKH